ncbi:MULTISPECIES: aspartyl-phosphate phosphatase Spo0E family protein [Brevibacillus]|nr:aspartyl-phosphate phosphatase Spo0E family protein [Brevibacillus borstelensis]MCC0566874.1 aspartyl-phosphate phosphatase Spo0E family protein [Brevibacillus borstelensis]MCM3473364.1 aspartyl-phosphate phosphatase Spo0E family protein [Brevibacillus borstelensis]MCM3561364.1 aspartyl-phosphate phosphatase Spo0E family protein [Brevibacillus borstelensis]MCM3594059.1 aspartyl-phosphate phosphatase Spo0E family protein [Brevibacillus borstelensis]MED1743916.1 aspartyl-phosphate phosphatase
MIRLVGEQEQNRHNETDLIRIIESLRGQLVELVQEKGFDNGEVVELSQRLDQYIVQYQNRMKIKSIK